MSDIIGVFILTISLGIIFYQIGQSIKDGTPRGMFYMIAGAIIILVDIGLPRVFNFIGLT